RARAEVRELPLISCKNRQNTRVLVLLLRSLLPNTALPADPYLARGIHGLHLRCCPVVLSPVAWHSRRINVATHGSRACSISQAQSAQAARARSRVAFSRRRHLFDSCAGRRSPLQSVI